jgi:hypothetical protein
MPNFEFKVKIQAENRDEAKKVLAGMFDIKKAVSTEDLIFFATAIKEKPSLVKKAKMFI